MSELSLNSLKNASFSKSCPPVTTRTRIFPAESFDDSAAVPAAEASKKKSAAEAKRMRKFFISPVIYHHKPPFPKNLIGRTALGEHLDTTTRLEARKRSSPSQEPQSEWKKRPPLPSPL